MCRMFCSYPAVNLPSGSIKHLSIYVLKSWTDDGERFGTGTDQLAPSFRPAGGEGATRCLPLTMTLIILKSISPLVMTRASQLYVPSSVFLMPRIWRWPPGMYQNRTEAGKTNRGGGKKAGVRVGAWHSLLASEKRHKALESFHVGVF